MSNNTKVGEACPHCNKIGGYLIKGTITGPVVSYYGENGEHEEDYEDSKTYRNQKVVRCGNCHRKITGLTLSADHQQIVEEKSDV